MKQNLTGYPSIDKPWLRYYQEKDITTLLPASSAYSYMRQNNIGGEHRVALDYMGRKITYGEMFEGIDLVANAFVSIGIKKGDIVVVITPTLPECVYAFYGLNKIGAVSDFFDPRTEPKIVYDELVMTKSKTIIIFEDFIDRFKNIIEQAQVENVIVLSANDSLPLYLKLLSNLKRTKKISINHIKYRDFIEHNQSVISQEITENVSDLPAVMEHTGGTTGTPKAVVLTNKNINAVVHDYLVVDKATSEDDSWLGVAFPFVAYALICGLHIPACAKMENYLCFDLKADKLKKQVVNNRINHMANTPIVWEQMTRLKMSKNCDLSFLKLPTVGADALPIEKEIEINNFLNKYNCTYKIAKGYGMTELASGVAVTPNNELNKLGSVGIPFVNTIISIFDIETGKELRYGEQGEICITGPSVMQGYFNNQEATEEVLKLHDDGKVWMHSGDLGHMDEEGFLFLDGRIKRMIINHMGFKIFAPKVEQVLSACDCVEKCSVVGANDKDNGFGRNAVAFIILKEGYTKDVVTSINEHCKENLPDYCVPLDYIIVEELPYTSAAKVDYRTLERIYEEM